MAIPPEALAAAMRAGGPAPGPGATPSPMAGPPPGATPPPPAPGGPPAPMAPPPVPPGVMPPEMARQMLASMGITESSIPMILMAVASIVGAQAPLAPSPMQPPPPPQM